MSLPPIDAVTPASIARSERAAARLASTGGCSRVMISLPSSP
jgi:hypothetical protein